MKRLPGLASFVLFIALCVSLAFWAMQLFKPAARAVAAPPPAATEVDLQAAAGLFGGRSTVAAASNFQLKGVVAAEHGGDSVAILSANGKPAQAVRQGAEILPGTVVKEVHKRYVLVSDGGVPKRVDLPENAPSSTLSSPIGSNSPPPSVRPNPPSSQPVPAVTVGPAMPIQQSMPGAPANPAMPPR
ncbi:MAG TPA: type II secretion system protein N [Burkholderiaceae bacterium]|nr:type II secretion system protein N [Burkholderiaceae bacterium]